MENHTVLIHTLYDCFIKKDFAGMAACYHPDATFEDAVFSLHSQKEIAAMWHYLVQSGKDLRIEFNTIEADAITGKAHWEAFYTFSATGKQVHNIINATFVFKDGQIILHTDTFDFWRWAGMALGMTGKLLGWSSFLQNSVRKKARQSLNRFITAHPQYQ